MSLSPHQKFSILMSQKSLKNSTIYTGCLLSSFAMITFSQISKANALPLIPIHLNIDTH
jgi:hypothetical protein